MTAEPLVSVIIPAYNAEATLDRTLRSVRSQTHRTLEIIVVDDGSTDGTPALANAHAQADARVRVLQQANSGVAAARNTGWQSACSDLLAFVDADDTWAPSKIEQQIAALTAGGEKFGLVYTGFAVIDANDRIEYEVRLHDQGDVMERMCRGNLVGHGSGVLVRREAVIAAEGFDPGLRAAGAQGCEDYLFYLRVAEKWHFAVVPEPLVGYRKLPDSMSSDMNKMLRSYIIVVDKMIERHPDKRRLFEDSLYSYATMLQRRLVMSRRLRAQISLLLLVTRHRPAMAARLLLLDMPREWFELISRALRRRERKLRRMLRPLPPQSWGPPPIVREFEIGEPL